MPLNLLSDDEQSYFMEMESLFNHPGWARLMREIRNELDQMPADAFQHAKTWEDIQAARARNAALQTLADYPDAIELRKQQIEANKIAEIDNLNDI